MLDFAEKAFHEVPFNVGQHGILILQNMQNMTRVMPCMTNLMINVTGYAKEQVL